MGEQQGDVVNKQNDHGNVTGTEQVEVLEDDHVLHRMRKKSEKQSYLAEITSFVIVQNFLVSVFHVLYHLGVSLLNV